MQVHKLLAPADDYRARITAVKAPALVIDAYHKSKQPGDTPPEKLAALMQHAQGHSVPQSSHYVHQDQPDRVNRLIEEWLDTVVCTS